MSETQTALPLELCAISRMGQGRPTNGDCVLARDLSAEPSNPYGLRAFLAVADSGTERADIESAASLAIRTLWSILTAKRTGERIAPGSRPNIARLARRMVEHTHRIIHAFQPVEGQYQTALTAALIEDNRYYVVHSGHCQALLLRSEQALPIAEEATAAGAPVQLLGGVEQPLPAVYAGELSDGDILLLCSDGLTGALEGDELWPAFAEKEDITEACQGLINLAFDRGGDDDISVAAALAGVRMPLALSSVKPEEKPEVQQQPEVEEEEYEPAAFWPGQGPGIEGILRALGVVIFGLICGIVGYVLGVNRIRTYPPYAFPPALNRPAPVQPLVVPSATQPGPETPPPVSETQEFVSFAVLLDKKEQVLKLSAEGGRLKLAPGASAELAEQKADQIIRRFRYPAKSIELLTANKARIILVDQATGQDVASQEVPSATETTLPLFAASLPYGGKYQAYFHSQETSGRILLCAFAVEAE